MRSNPKPSHREKERKQKSSNQPASRASWPVSYKWFALGTLAVYTAVGSEKVNPAFAQQAPPRPASGQTGPAPSSPQQFNIAAGPLDGALTSFEQTASVQVVVSDGALRGVQSPGVTGLYNVSKAMEELLKGTGISYRFTGPQTLTLELSRLSSTVDVHETATALAASMPKYSAELRDIPQSIDVVSQKTMDEQNVTTLRDALRNVAGISLAAGEGGAQGDSLTIRGFTARNDLFIDGMRDFGSYYRDPFDVQEVEVLQGPSSMTFGRGSTGGVVNQATKAPSITKFIAGDVTFGTENTKRITTDINTPLPWMSRNAAFRLNVMGDEGNVAGRDVAENRRFGVAPSLEFGLGTPTRVTLGELHQTADDTPDYGIPWLFNGPAPVNHNNYYGFKKGNYLRTYDDIATIKAEHDINSHVTLRNQLRYANYVRHAQITEPQYVTAPTLATPLSAILVKRNEITVNSVEGEMIDQLDLTANFETGFLRHSVVTGGEFGKEFSNPIRPTYSNVPTTSLLNPNENDIFTATYVPSTNVHTTAKSAGVYVVDTVHFAKRFELIGGIRWDRFNTHYTQAVAPATAFNRLDEQPTWRAGLVYHPLPSGSVYASASTSFNPSAESLSLSAGNANLPPEKNRNVEGGTKWDLFNRKLSLRGAVFQTLKLNARETDPTNSLSIVLAGNQRVNGQEVTVNGHLTRRWELQSGYAHLDARVTSSLFYPAAVGAHLANVAANTFNFWSTYRLPKRWEAGVGGNFVGSRTASSTVPLDPVTGLVKQVPSYWVFNAMLSHSLTEHISVQANIYNLANRYYYDQLHPAHIILGASRYALIGIKYKF